MILPDDTPASPAKVRPGPPPQVSEEDLNPPLPPYPGPSQPVHPPAPSYGTVPQPPHHGVPYQSYGIYPHVDVEAQGGNARSRLVPPRPPPPSALNPDRRAARRFFKSFIFAFIIYVAVVSFIGTIITASTQWHWSGTHPTLKVSKLFFSLFPGSGPERRCCVPRVFKVPDTISGRLPVPRSQLPKPTRKDGNVKKCLSSSTFRTNADLTSPYSISLPLSASTLYIFGRGSLTHGSIEFSSVQDPSIAPRAYQSQHLSWLPGRCSIVANQSLRIGEGS